MIYWKDRNSFKSLFRQRLTDCIAKRPVRQKSGEVRQKCRGKFCRSAAMPYFCGGYESEQLANMRNLTLKIMKISLYMRVVPARMKPYFGFK